MLIPTAIVIGALVASVLLMILFLAILPGLDEIGGSAERSPGQYLHALNVGANRFDTIQMPMINWEVDGAAGATKAATGTNGQWVKTTLEFAVAAADDIAYGEFTVPSTYNEEFNEMWLCLLVNVNDTDKTHHGDWDGVVKRMPFVQNESDDATLVDEAWTEWTALTVVQQVTDDTPYEAYRVIMDISVVDWKKCDWAQIAIWNDISANDLGNTAFVHNAFVLARH